jgi:hypothetical protein
MAYCQAHRAVNIGGLSDLSSVQNGPMQIAQVSVPIVFPFHIDRANGSTKAMSDSNFHVVLLVTWDGTC